MTTTQAETADTRAALERAAEPPERQSVRALIERMEPELVKSLREPAAAQALMRHYLNAMRGTPALLDCSTESVLGGLMLSAQVGLEPGPLGHVYLIPYGNVCQWVLGYTGIIELSRRSQACADLTSDIVREGDVYERPWRNASGVHFEHRPADEADRGDPVGLLVTWRELSGGKWFARAEHVPMSRVERARKASKAKSGPWFTDTDAMMRKTGVRAVRPFLPLSPVAAQGFAVDGAIVSDVTVIEEHAEPVMQLPEGGE